MGLWGREPSLRQQEPSPQEMSHRRVGAAATSASAAGASGGEQVPETAPPCVCLSPPPRVHSSTPAGLVCMHTYVSPSARMHSRYVPGLRGGPCSQAVGCPSFGNDGYIRFSPALGWRGRNRKELVSAHKAHPRSCRAVGSLFVGLCSILVCRGLPARGGAGSPPRPGRGLARPQGLPGGCTSRLMGVPCSIMHT